MRGALAVCIGLIALAGCSDTTPNEEATYTFDPNQSGVQVDSAELRELKAAAGIEPCPQTDPATKPVSGGLPAIMLPCLGGGDDVQLSGLRGTPLVLNFWAQTCGPCRTESPLFQQLHEAAGESVRVVGIDWQDPQPDRAILFADELGLTYPQVADPEGATRAPMRISALPITVFVDSDGRIAHTEFGAVDSVAELTTLVEDHLGVQVEVGEVR